MVPLRAKGSKIHDLLQEHREEPQVQEGLADQADPGVPEADKGNQEVPVVLEDRAVQVGLMVADLEGQVVQAKEMKGLKAVMEDGEVEVVAVVLEVVEAVDQEVVDNEGDKEAEEGDRILRNDGPNWRKTNLHQTVGPAELSE